MAKLLPACLPGQEGGSHSTLPWGQRKCWCQCWRRKSIVTINCTRDNTMAMEVNTLAKGRHHYCTALKGKMRVISQTLTLCLLSFSGDLCSLFELDLPTAWQIYDILHQKRVSKLQPWKADIHFHRVVTVLSFQASQSCRALVRWESLLIQLLCFFEKNQVSPSESFHKSGPFSTPFSKIWSLSPSLL